MSDIELAVGEIVGKNGKEYPVIHVTPPAGVDGFFIFVSLTPPPKPEVAPHPGAIVLDIAYPQETVDWKTLREVGKATHVVIRSSQGMIYKDEYFDVNWPAAKAAGLVRAVYHLLETERNGQRVSMDGQARRFYGFVEGDPPEWFYGMDYEPAIINQPHATPAEIDLFHSTLKGLVGGAEQWNYTSIGMWPGYSRSEPTWAADYTPPLNAPRGLPAPSLWQIGVAKVPGIKGWVDVNMYIKGMSNPVAPAWAYKRTGPKEKRAMYFANAKDKAALIEFYDKPDGVVHTRRAVGYKMGVFRVTLDGKWVCVVDGGAPDWWCRMDDVVVL